MAHSGAAFLVDLAVSRNIRQRWRILAQARFGAKNKYDGARGTRSRALVGREAPGRTLLRDIETDQPLNS